MGKDKIGDTSGAIADYDRAISINSSAHEVYYNRGFSRLKMGDKQGACADWKKASHLGFKQGDEALAKYCQ
jgi:tetratricopeptide (TPR) repeat protein